MTKSVALTEKMKLEVKNSVTVIACDFKYSPVFDKKRNDFYHAVMIRGPVTKGEWVLCGSTNDGIYEFESEAQAKLFISEIENEFKSRVSEA